MKYTIEEIVAILEQERLERQGFQPQKSVAFGTVADYLKARQSEGAL